MVTFDTDPFPDSIPIGPRPPQTCQRLTTNRPIESAPDKLGSFIPTFSAGALPIGTSRIPDKWISIDPAVFPIYGFAVIRPRAVMPQKTQCRHTLERLASLDGLWAGCSSASASVL